jgi:predicted DNA-binding protein (MmcQ/YjbR family)
MQTSHKDVEEYILSLSGAYLDYPFGKDVVVYKVPSHKKEDNGKMFALIAENKLPIRISLKCEPKLSEFLKEKYESVMPGYHLNKKHWITVVMTGQLSWDEIKDLIRHSYELVIN